MSEQLPGEAKIDSYMRLYVADWLEATADLTLEEQGAYLRLLAHMWKRRGHLAIDHDCLARLLYISRTRWLCLWGRLKRYFIVDEEASTFSQKRLLAELEKAKRGRQQRAIAGRKSGVNRRGNISQMIERPFDSRSTEQLTSRSTDELTVRSTAKLAAQRASDPDLRSDPDDPDPDPDRNAKHFSAEPKFSAPAAKEPPEAFEPEDPTPVVCQLPLTANRSFGVTQKRVEIYRGLYPAVDVTREIDRLSQWLADNPDRKNATPRGLKKRISVWLGKAHDQASRGFSNGFSPGIPRADHLRRLDP